jgi:hypothetical protein
MTKGNFNRKARITRVDRYFLGSAIQGFARFSERIRLIFSTQILDGGNSSPVQ